MRIEPAKNNQKEKHESSNFKQDKSVFKTEKSVFDASGLLKSPEAPKTPTGGAFAKILDEAREEAARGKDKLSGASSDAPEAAAKTGDTEEDRETRRAEQKSELEEKNNRQEGGDGDSPDDENAAAFAAKALAAETKPATEANAPAARAILHIADLERIVSYVRTEKFRDAQAVLIALKHSVLEGLQVRLVLRENGQLKAEFLAANEHIKKQLKRRERELLDILRQRSSKFTEVEVLLS